MSDAFVAPDAPLRPLLQRYPNARAASVPLLEPVLLPYVSLLLGSACAGALAAYNAIAMRRWALAAVCVAIGAAGWLAFAAIVIGVENANANVRLVIFVGRAMQFILGGVLFALQRRSVRGHEFLHGRMLPLPATYLLAFGLAMVMPGTVLALMLGVPPGR